MLNNFPHGEVSNVKPYDSSQYRKELERVVECYTCIVCSFSVKHYAFFNLRRRDVLQIYEYHVSMQIKLPFILTIQQSVNAHLSFDENENL